MGGVERLIGPHDGDERVGIGEIDDVVGVAGEHVDGLDVVAADIKLYHLVGTNLALLDEGMAADNDEELPLGVVPMLALSDAREGDVDAELAAVGRAEQFGERTALVDVHLQGKGHFLLGQIAQVGGVKFFLNAAGGNLGYDEGGGLVVVLVQQFNDAAESDFVGDRAVAIASVVGGHDAEALKLAVPLTAFKGVKHTGDEVVDVEQLELHRGVVDLDGKVVGDVVAEGGHSAVVVGAAPLAKEVGETVDEHLCAGLYCVKEKEVFASFLAASVL